MRNRRGISSVVGTVFAIIALTTTVAYVSYSMNTLDKYNQTVLGKSQQTLDVGKEKFQVSNVAIASNKFNITVANTGNLPINITKIWVQNTSATDWVRSYIPANSVVSPGATLKNIGQNIPVFASTSQSYHIKLVTSRGNAQEFNANSVNAAPLNIQFYALPSNVDIGYTTELVMIVTNNGSNTLTNIVPNQPSSAAGTANYVLSAQPIPSSASTLAPGDTAIFKWDVRMTGQAGQFRTFNATLSNGYNHNYATTTVTLAAGVTSVGTAPLNIQLLSLPPTIPSAYTTVIAMIVTNNQSSTVTNVIPQISKWVSNPSPSNAICALSATPSPPFASTLPPGVTAVFTWNLKMTGNANNFCTYNATLAGAYNHNYAMTTATINPITATSSNWSTTWGILSINYTTLQWTQNGGTTWNNAWDIPCCINTVWRVDVTDNDPTRAFIFNGNTTLVAFGTSPGSNTATQWYVVKNDYPPIHAYHTNGQSIPANSTGKLYFGASTPAGTSGVNIGNSAKGQYAISVLLFGYWNSVQTTNFFGQNIPYEGIIVG